MEVKAKARYIRMSPRKIRLVIDVVRGMPVDEALTQLRFMKKAAALPVFKLVSSAVANAVHNDNLKREDLFIKKITADGGPTFHRWRARAFGRAAPIRKRTAHINVVLDEVATRGKAPVKEESKPGLKDGSGSAGKETKQTKPKVTSDSKKK